MRRIAVVGIAGLALLVSGGVSKPEASSAPFRLDAGRQGRPLLGIVGQWGRDARLVRVDPRSMRPLGGPELEIFGTAGAWAFSPDRSRLALATACQAGVSLGTLELVDARALRPVGCLDVGNVGAVAWPTANRLLVMASSEVLLIDPVAKRIIGRTPVESPAPAASARVRDRLIGLFGQFLRNRRFVPQRLVVADARGSVRAFPLEGVRQSALVVDPGGRQAYLVSGGTVVKVDLDKLAVNFVLRSSQDGSRRAQNATRGALWLSRGLIASFGRDQTIRGRRAMDVPVGLRLIDVRSRTVRMLDEKVNSARLVEDVLLATGSSGIGLLAFDVRGRKRFQLFRGRPAFVIESFGPTAYVQVGEKPALRVVDVRTGRVVGLRRGPPPRLLVER